jgi:hypothetical protein
MFTPRLYILDYKHGLVEGYKRIFPILFMFNSGINALDNGQLMHTLNNGV